MGCSFLSAGEAARAHCSTSVCEIEQPRRAQIGWLPGFKPYVRWLATDDSSASMRRESGNAACPQLMVVEATGHSH